MAYENMSSLDMAAALEEHKKGCSEGLLLAVAARLRDQYMRIGNLEEISDEEVIRSQCATRRAVERAIAAERERDRLREALEHTISSFRLVVECKPCRDVTETIADAESALRGDES